MRSPDLSVALVIPGKVSPKKKFIIATAACLPPTSSGTTFAIMPVVAREYNVQSGTIRYTSVSFVHRVYAFPLSVRLILSHNVTSSSPSLAVMRQFARCEY